MSEPLRNTEEGDVCVTHGATWEGVYSDSVGVDVEDPWPICTEVSEGYERASEMCRFVPADSTDDARMNTPAEDR